MNMLGKLVVITGVTRGLGRALALELARRGHSVVGCGRNEDDLAALKRHLNDESKHLLEKADVASDSSVAIFAKKVVECKGVPDIVVNSAGIINKNNKIWDVPTEECDAVIDINVKGPANIMRHFLPYMNLNRRGIIVNMTSGWGRAGAADVAPYCASKWAIEGITRAVAKEVPLGVAVIALNPGVLNTDMLASCFGLAAAMYPHPAEWAPHVADTILGFTADDNGSSLNVV